MNRQAGRDPEVRTFVAIGDGRRLDVSVAENLDLSRNQAATLIADGRVLVDGRREKASYRLRADEAVRVEIPPPPGRTVDPEAIPLSIAYEDEDAHVAADRMESEQIRRLLVLNENEELVGIISLGDLSSLLDESETGRVLEGISQPSPRT